MKRVAIVLFLVALAILIDLLLQGPSRQERGSIVGSETDSAGGRYIYKSNGEVYHRRQESDAPRGYESYGENASFEDR